jgi:arylsulfatase
MNRRTFLGGLAGALASQVSFAAKARPNVLLIMADDMGFSDIGCYGGEVDTPNVNKLAESGVRFTQMYNTARCCPTRAALLTGLYSHQAGVGRMVEDYDLPGYRGFLNDRCVTIAEALRPSGYRTLMSGKWHVGEQRPHWPVDRGFDRFYGLVSGGSNYFSLDPGRVMAYDDKLAKPEGNNFYFTEAFTDHAINFLDDRKPQQPFFLYLPYTAPHWPLHALEQDIQKYKQRYLAGWDKIRETRLARQRQMKIVDKQWGLTPRDAQVLAWEATENKEWEVHRMAVYSAQIDRMDQGIGRVLAKVRAMGEEDNTLVLFLADNGGCAELIEPNFRNLDGKVRTAGDKVVHYGNVPSIMPGPADTFQSYGVGWANASNTPFRLYKSMVHEGGISTPLIARWPAGGVKGNRLHSQVGHVIDLMPTILEATGTEAPKTYQGKPIQPIEGTSLLPALRGKVFTRPKPIFWEHIGNRAVRDGDWKLVARRKGPWELYNLKEDRCEINNLAATQPEKAAAMQSLYNAWAQRANVVPVEELESRKPKGFTSS